MNIKRIFGAILTVIGIVGLISTASLFLSTARGNSDIKILLIYGFLGLLFFITCIRLVRTTKDKS